MHSEDIVVMMKSFEDLRSAEAEIRVGAWVPEIGAEVELGVERGARLEGGKHRGNTSIESEYQGRTVKTIRTRADDLMTRD